jgi:hypothetical protein
LLDSLGNFHLYRDAAGRGDSSMDGLSDFFPITDRSPLEQIAGQMKVGEFYGPLTVQGGILYFKL